MTAIESPSGEIRQQSRVRWLAPVILLVALAAGWIAFRGAGRWLVREDSLSKADVIVVLSGGLPYRGEEAAALFNSAYAPAVWISRPEGPGPQLAKLGIHFVGEEEYNHEVLMRKGVPAAAIEILPDTVIDTQQEVEEVSREMRRTGKYTVVIVTSPGHTRRVKALWSKLADPGLRLIVRAAPDDPYDADHWWRNTRDAQSVLREFLGLLNAWAGLPVRPHTL
ncbi:MAG: YdcF family protein [Candidatus Acidiferrales bacterium]